MLDHPEESVSHGTGFFGVDKSKDLDNHRTSLYNKKWNLYNLAAKLTRRRRL